MKMSNPWIKSKITVSPYPRTAFKVLGIDCHTVSPREIRRCIEDRKLAVERVPGVFKLGNEDLTRADITRAGEILADPNRRIVEELLEHRPEKPQLEEIERLKKKLPEPHWPEPTPSRINPAFLIPVIQDIVNRHLLGKRKNVTELLQKGTTSRTIDDSETNETSG